MDGVHIDWGTVATFIGILGAAFMALMGSVYKMGQLARTFDTHVRKISEWEGAMHNLNAIPDLKIGIEALNTRIGKSEERMQGKIDVIKSDFADLKSEVSLLKGRVGLGTLRANIDKDE